MAQEAKHSKQLEAERLKITQAAKLELEQAHLLQNALQLQADELLLRAKPVTPGQEDRATWESDGRTDQKLFPVYRGSDEFSAIETVFQRTMPNVHIKQLQR